MSIDILRYKNAAKRRRRKKTPLQRKTPLQINAATKNAPKYVMAKTPLSRKNAEHETTPRSPQK